LALPSLEKQLTRWRFDNGKQRRSDAPVSADYWALPIELTVPLRLVNQIIDTHAELKLRLLLPKLYRPVDGVLLSGFGFGLSSASLPNSIREIITGLRQMPAQIETI